MWDAVLQKKTKTFYHLVFAKSCLKTIVTDLFLFTNYYIYSSLSFVQIVNTSGVYVPFYQIEEKWFGEYMYVRDNHSTI